MNVNLPLDPTSSEWCQQSLLGLDGFSYILTGQTKVVVSAATMQLRPTSVFNGGGQILFRCCNGTARPVNLEIATYSENGRVRLKSENVEVGVDALEEPLGRWRHSAGSIEFEVISAGLETLRHECEGDVWRTVIAVVPKVVEDEMIELGRSLEVLLDVLKSVPEVAYVIRGLSSSLGGAFAFQIEDGGGGDACVAVAQTYKERIDELVREHSSIISHSSADTLEKEKAVRRLCAEVVGCLIAIAPMKDQIPRYDMLLSLFNETIPGSVGVERK